MTEVFDTNLQPTELAARLLGEITRALDYTRSRRRTFRCSAIVLRLTSLVLLATSTLILGLQDLDFWASLAFSLVALTTILGAVEPFFNWRSRWVLMEEMQARLHRLESDLRHFLAKSAPDDLTHGSLDDYFGRLQTIWEDTQVAWVESRQTEQRQP